MSTEFNPTWTEPNIVTQKLFTSHTTQEIISVEALDTGFLDDTVSGTYDIKAVRYKRNPARLDVIGSIATNRPGVSRSLIEFTCEELEQYSKEFNLGLQHRVSLNTRESQAKLPHIFLENGYKQDPYSLIRKYNL